MASGTHSSCGCDSCSCHAPEAPAPKDCGSVEDFLAEILTAEARLDTPVARFAEAHAGFSEARTASLRAQLLPLTAPGPGEQYAFEVDLDACSGCKACVSACHSLNGLDETETWRDVGLLRGGDSARPYVQTITSACHHCAEPGCLEGCPVLAYEKDPLTGIVRHLDDQCIGCQYCILKCPYDVPKYNARLGIVRKCDLCQQRLREGEAPACAQACPTHAIRIVTVPTGAAVDTSRFLAAAPDAALTKPTTRYVSTRTIPANARPVDAETLRPAAPHLSLVFLLTLNQAGTGLLLGGAFAGAPSTLSLVGLGLLAAALAASVTHLGQPLRAWRVFLGLRRSWLSREAVLLGLSFPLLATAMLGERFGLPSSIAETALWPGLIAGLAGILCSGMIYIDTGRRHWAAFNTAVRMGGTVLVFTLALVEPRLAAPAILLKLLLESRVLWAGPQRDPRLRLSARTLLGPLRAVLGARLALGLLAATLLPFVPLSLCLPVLLAAELLERLLYFRAVEPSAMPGHAGATEHPHP